MTDVVQPATSVSGSAGRVPWWGSRIAWMVLAIIAVAVLAIGSHRDTTSSVRSHEAYLDSVIKCPSCEDLSIAQSDAPSAVELRHRVNGFVVAGWSSSRIESWVTGRYGSDSLLVPQASGESATLYFVPIGLIGLAVLGVGWYFWRRRPGATRT